MRKLKALRLDIQQSTKTQDALMLANLALQIQAHTPKLSRAFWLCTAFGYGAGILAIVSIFLADTSVLSASGAVGERAVFHLNVVRLTVIGAILVIFPVLLLTSLRGLFYFVISITAWVTMIYIDDVLVLYTIIQYPQSASINLVLTLRPFAIIGLLWMSFELHLRLKNGS